MENPFGKYKIKNVFGEYISHPDPVFSYTGEPIKNYQNRIEQLIKTKKLYLSIKLIEDSEIVELRLHTINNYSIYILHDKFRVIGIRSEDTSTSVLYNIASHISVLLFDAKCPLSDIEAIDPIAYQIAIDFMNSNTDKCMWDITNAEHIVKIDPCEDHDLYDTETDDYEANYPTMDQFNSLNNRLEALEKAVYSNINLSEFINLHWGTKK